MPFGQGLHVNDAGPDAKVPGSHITHESGTWAPVTLEAVPGLQGVQAVASVVLE